MFVHGLDMMINQNKKKTNYYTILPLCFSFIFVWIFNEIEQKF